MPFDRIMSVVRGTAPPPFTVNGASATLTMELAKPVAANDRFIQLQLKAGGSAIAASASVAGAIAPARYALEIQEVVSALAAPVVFGGTAAQRAALAPLPAVDILVAPGADSHFVQGILIDQPSDLPLATLLGWLGALPAVTVADGQDGAIHAIAGDLFIRGGGMRLDADVDGVTVESFAVGSSDPDEPNRAIPDLGGPTRVVRLHADMAVGGVFPLPVGRAIAMLARDLGHTPAAASAVTLRPLGGPVDGIWAELDASGSTQEIITSGQGSVPGLKRIATAVYRIPYGTQIVEDDAVTVDGHAWDVTGVEPEPGRPGATLVRVQRTTDVDRG